MYTCYLHICARGEVKKEGMRGRGREGREEMGFKEGRERKRGEGA